MSLAPGTRLGAYDIVALIGAGGMGEVYRATDIRLDRTVAIKILPQQFAGDPELRLRFEREARAISSLEHPHICALYDVGEHEGRTFLVMPHLDGKTIEARLIKGALPVQEALRIATDICDALDKAHRAGIVHRDLKPANVMLTKSGAKLLDFGLAKSAAPVVATTGLSMLPTTPPSLTAKGTILGSFLYMAPEQIEGLEADARTDIFAFGALLFEMLTARRAFDGKTRASLLGAILKDEPLPVSSVQPTASKALDRVVSTCLAKDPDDRYQSARDLLRDLKWAASSAAVDQTAPSTSPRRPARQRLAWTVAAIASLALIGLTVRHRREVAPVQNVIQFTIGPPENATFAPRPGGGTGIAAQLAVAPDGWSVVFVARLPNRLQLFLRSLDSAVARPVSGTEDASFPFWSPDSRYIGFFAEGKLKKVPVAGGPPIVLCDALAGRGGAWNQDNVIIFAPASTTGSVLQRVSSAGGVPQPASTLDKEYGETFHRFPAFLPDGRHFLFNGAVGTCCPPSKPGRLRIGTLDSMDATTLVQADSSAAFASGHVLFNRGVTLIAQPFDETSRQLTGDPFPLAENIAAEGSRYSSFSVSETGVLVFANGLAQAMTQLTWVDRSGRALGTTVGDIGMHLGIAMSPDNTRVAVDRAAGAPMNRDIWILDLSVGTLSRLTFDAGADLNPVWSPDNLSIVFRGDRQGASAMRRKRADGTANEAVLLTSGGFDAPFDWSSDGHYVTYAHRVGPGTSDIWALPLFGDRKPIPLSQTPFSELNATFSPDARWFAYQSNESGQTQIYVQPFPPTGSKFQISTGGGMQPVWRPDGKELFFLTSDSMFMASAVDAAGGFKHRAPVPLFQYATLVSAVGVNKHYAVAKDGRRFLVNALQEQSRSIPLTVIVNWLATVQQ
jgi:serine/threonine protein kinase